MIEKLFHIEFKNVLENEILNEGLKIEWGESNFVNPPYTQKLKEGFIKKGVEEMKKGKPAGQISLAFDMFENPHYNSDLAIIG